MLFRKYTTGFPMTAAGRALARQRTQADMGVLNENTGLPFQSMPRASPRDQKPAKTGMVKGGRKWERVITFLKYTLLLCGTPDRMYCMVESIPSVVFRMQVTSCFFEEVLQGNRRRHIASDLKGLMCPDEIPWDKTRGEAASDLFLRRAGNLFPFLPSKEL